VALGQDIDGFIGHWIGTEDLNSPSSSYQYRNISIQIKYGGEREGLLVFNSSSNFLHNEDLNWAYHYLGYDKDNNKVTFMRRFLTPLGVLGYEEIQYNIIEYREDFLLAVHESITGDVFHQIRIEKSFLDVKKVKPEQFTVLDNYPNPFNPKTKINIFIEKDAHISLDIFTINGRKIRTLFNGSVSSGVNQFTWDGKNSYGEKVSSGIYINTLMENGFLIGSNRMLMLK
jgi:hypothetical protein